MKATFFFIILYLDAIKCVNYVLFHVFITANMSGDSSQKAGRDAREKNKM